MGLPGFGPEFPTPEAGRIPGYPTDPYPLIVLSHVLILLYYSLMRDLNYTNISQTPINL